MSVAGNIRVEKIARRALLTGLAGLACTRPRSAWALEPAAPSIILTMAEAAPPVSFRDAGGRMAGMVVDGMSAVTAPLGWNLAFEGMPWARSQEMVRQGQADAHVTLATPDRLGFMRFARAPLFIRNSAVIHFSPRNPRAAEIRRIRSLDDLRGFAITMTLGDSWPRGMMDGWTNVLTVKDDATTFLMVAADRADIVVQSREAAKFAEQANGIQQLDSIDAPFLVGGLSEFRFGLRLAFPDSAALMDAFDRAQQRMIQNGTLSRVMAKYV